MSTICSVSAILVDSRDKMEVLPHNTPPLN